MLPVYTSSYKISKFQEKVIGIDERLNLFLGGGRGGAKTYLMAILADIHCRRYGSKANVQYFREFQKSTSHFQGLIEEVTSNAPRIPHPTDVTKSIPFITYNKKDYEFLYYNGARISLNPLHDRNDYGKHHGKTYSLILVDEVGEYSEEQITSFIDPLRSCLRGTDIPRRLIFSGNPGGEGHHLIYNRYVKQREPWDIFDDPIEQDPETLKRLKQEEYKPRRWIFCPSTYLDNPFIDQVTYVADLLASNAHDPDLVRAWISGDWDMNRGAFFDERVLDPRDNGRNKIDSWKPFSIGKAKGSQYWKERWNFYLTHDYGTSSPSATYVVGVSPGGEGPDGLYYPKDSLVFLDELVTNMPGSKTKGQQLNVHDLAGKIKDLADMWDIPPYGPADDQIFSNDGRLEGDIASEFRKYGINFVRANKGKSRLPGWQKMKQMMFDAGRIDENNFPVEKPGLYVSSSCKYFWDTVPYLIHDARRDGDLIGDADHAADAVRYMITFTQSNKEITAEHFRYWG